MDELLEVVDENNRVIGTEKRSVINKRLLTYRSVHLLMLNGKGELLLVKRSMKKDTHPGCWSFSVGGHILPGESPDDALRRETREELGIETDAEYVTLLPAEKESGNHFLYLYLARLERIPELRLNEKELSGMMLLSKEEVRKRLKDGVRFSPAFVRSFKWLVENGKI